MYGGVAGSIGIENQINGSLVQITLSLCLQIYNEVEWVRISSPGIIVADVESLTVTNSESIQGNVTNAGNVWKLIYYNMGRLTSSTSTYSIDITSNGTNKTFKGYNTTNNTSTADKQESAVMIYRNRMGSGALSTFI